jgi:serine/threonine protein kinase
MVWQPVSHYRLLEKLDGGGVGVLYKAEDTENGRTVALRVLPVGISQDRQAVERFLSEARSVSALEHPNIWTVFEAGEHEGRLFIAMELPTGQTLERRIGSQPLPTETLLELAIQVAGALGALHSREIVHGDINPSNIFVSEDNQAKILGLGTAKLLKSEGPGGTATGTTIGAVAYWSPEQVRGEKLKLRSDIFSLGTVLYEMATGSRAFDASSTAETKEAVLSYDPIPPTEINPAVPTGLERVIQTAMEKDSKLRYPNATSLRHYLIRLQQNLGSEQTVETAAPRQPVDRPTTLQRVSLAPLVFIGLAILVGIAVIAFLNRCTPTRFSRGEPIGIGVHQLTVSSVEAAGSGENLELSVFHSWVRVASDEGRRGFRFKPRFRLVDSEGRWYRSSGFMDADTYRSWDEQRRRGFSESGDQGGIPEDWVVSFTVPKESEGFSLSVNNPERRKGQPCSVIVSLGR